MFPLNLFHPWAWLGSPLPRPTYATQGWSSAREKRDDIHRGLDLRAAVGTPTYAVGSGVIEYAEYNSPTAGNWIGVRLPSGLLTRHLHLSQIDVKKGQQVSKGQRIGLTGNTGDSAGPHLHFDAELPPDKVSTYVSLFGKPVEGFANTSFGVKVPIEPLIPVDSYADSIIQYSMTHQMPLRGGASRWIAMAALGAAGYVAWRNRDRIKGLLRS